MTTPTSRSTYRVYYNVLDKAVDSEVGIRIGFDEEGAANQYRLRLNYARKLDRKLNCAGRDRDDPNYGLSDYDNLIFRVLNDEGTWWVYVERITMPERIEEL